MVRLCVPVIPPANMAKGLKVPTVEVFTRRDTQTLLLAGLAGAAGQGHAHQYQAEDIDFHFT